MAARTGASIGVAIAITVLAVFAFTFFVLTLVFFGRAQDAQKGKDQAMKTIAEFVTEQQRTQTPVQQALREAKDNNQTVVWNLISAQREIMERVSGNRDMTPSKFFEDLNGIAGSDAASMFGMLAQRDEAISSKDAALTDAEAGRQAAIARADAEAERVSQLAKEFEASGLTLRNEVGSYTNEIQATRLGYDQVEKRLQDNLSSTVTTFENKERDYRAQVAQMKNENLILQDQLRRLRQESRGGELKPLAEESLVDGTVQAIDPSQHEVVISIGRQQKVILGMKFAVYSDSTDIRPNALTGEYPSGKATLEVVRVEDGFSRARIISEARGNPIVRGDVIANAVYDPSKTYKFVVYGLFDTNGDGVESKYERDDVATMIRSWGGQVVDDLDGDLDFVVLGERPSLPPRPGVAATPEEINAYIEIQKAIARYDELRDKAVSTAVPILNENRLRTLIGGYPN